MAVKNIVRILSFRNSFRCWLWLCLVSGLFPVTCWAVIDWRYLDNTTSKQQAFAAALAGHEGSNPRMVLMIVYSSGCSHCTVVGAAMNGEPAFTMLQEDFEIWRAADPSSIAPYVQYLGDISPTIYPLIAVIDPRTDRALKASRAAGNIGEPAEFKEFYETVRAVHKVQSLSVSRDGNGVSLEWNVPFIRPGYSDNVDGYLVARYPGPAPATDLSLGSRTQYSAGQTVDGWKILAVGSESGFPAGTRGAYGFADTAGLNPEVGYTYSVFAYSDPVPHGQVRRIHSEGTVATADPVPLETDAVTAGQVLPMNQGNDLAWTLPGGNAVGVAVLRAPAADDLPDPLPDGAVTPGQTVGQAQVVYAGAGSSFIDNRADYGGADDAPLSNGEDYHYALYAYNDIYIFSPPFVPNGSPARPNFLARNATALQADDALNQAVKLSWTNPGAANLAGILVLRRVGAAPPEGPDDAVALRSGRGTRADSDLAAELTVAAGEISPGLPASFVDASLQNGVDYYYKVFAFDSDGTFSSGVVVGPAEPTFIGEPPTDGSMVAEFSCAVDLMWQNPDPGNLAGIVVVHKSTDAPSATPSQIAALLGDGTPLPDGSEMVAMLTTDGGDIVPGGVTTWRHEGAINGQAHFYRLFAYDQDQTVSSGLDLGPAAPDFSYAGLQNASLNWEYGNDSGATGIRIDWSYDDDQCIVGVLVLQTSDTDTTPTPVGGTQYAEGAIFEAAEVVLSGLGTAARDQLSFYLEDGPRAAGSTHHYTIFPMSAGYDYGQPLRVTTDADGDRLDDHWEEHFTYGQYDATNPNLDTDGDTLTNRYEFQNLSDPTDTNDPQAPPAGLQLLGSGWHNRPFLLEQDRQGSIGEHIDQFTGYAPIVWYWDGVGGRFQDGSADAVGARRTYWLYLNSPVYMVVDDSATRTLVSDSVQLNNGWNNVTFPQWVCDSIGPGREYPDLESFLASELGQYWNAAGGYAIWSWTADRGGFGSAGSVTSIDVNDPFWLFLKDLPGGSVAIGQLE